MGWEIELEGHTGGTYDHSIGNTGQDPCVRSRKHGSQGIRYCLQRRFRPYPYLIRGLKEIACMRLHESVETGNICIGWQAANGRRRAVMGIFYGQKIRNKEVNPRTGKSWKLSDVPSLRRKKTEEWLKANQ